MLTMLLLSTVPPVDCKRAAAARSLSSQLSGKREVIVSSCPRFLSAHTTRVCTRENTQQQTRRSNEIHSN